MSRIRTKVAAIAWVGVIGSLCSSPPGQLRHIPDLLWQIEFPDDAARQRNLKIRLESPEFAAVRDRMKPLISRGDVSTWQKN